MVGVLENLIAEASGDSL
jgi:hypothetical protein